ncbi:MAG: hypothetical protein AB8C40_00510 [Gammaproteobacteria bacterium]
MSISLLATLFLTLTIALQPVLAELEFSGSISYEARWFPNSAQFPEQLHGVQNSIAIEPEWIIENGDHQFSFIPFARIDSRDNDRTHGDIREAYWLYIQDNWELLIGFNREFWGVTESRHLINVLNQIDTVENIDEEDYLGQAMINLAIQKDYGRFSFYVLPLFRERIFAGEDGRLRSALIIDEDEADYDSSAEQWHTDFALRYSHYFGDWDIGASYFYGTGREPTLRVNESGTRLIPHYDIINQFGLDIQYTNEEWLWKFEGLIREGQGDTFAATVFGFEYTFFQFRESDADLGILIEHLYDDRDEIDAPSTAFENDLFLGMRYTFNDIQDTSFLAGMITDLEDESYSMRLEAERRIGDSLKLELEGQLFTNSRDTSVTSAFRNDDFIQLSISKYF